MSTRNKVKPKILKNLINFDNSQKIFIAKRDKQYIITCVLGASSNGRTRDFGSLYHGSNPCAPTRINKNTLLGVFIYSWAHGSVRARKGA